jgi:GH24 family phage-related lysozyme (muramidase)
MAFTFEIDDEPDVDWQSSVRQFLATPPPAPRTFSQLGLDTLKAREGGFLSSPYDDSGTGPAIGYGFRSWQGQPVTPGMTITQQQADEEFRRQIDTNYGKQVLDTLKVPVTQDQLDALLSVQYNHPATAQSIIAKLNRGEQPTVEDFMASATVGGKPHKGLEERRRFEFAPFAPASADAAPPADDAATAGLNEANWRDQVSAFLQQGEMGPLGPEADLVTGKVNLGGPRPSLFPPSATDIEKQVIASAPGTKWRQRPEAYRAPETLPEELPTPLTTVSTRTGQVVPTGETTPGRPAVPHAGGMTGFEQQLGQAFGAQQDEAMRAEEARLARESPLGRLLHAPEAITGPVKRAGQSLEEAAITREPGEAMPEYFAMHPAIPAGAIAGAAEAAAEQLSPANIAMMATGALAAKAAARLEQLGQDAVLLFNLSQQASTLKEAQTFSRLYETTLAQAQQLERLRTTIAAGHGLAGAGFTAEGVSTLLTAPTLEEKLWALPQMAGGAAMGLEGINVAGRPSVPEAIRAKAWEATQRGLPPPPPPAPRPGPPIEPPVRPPLPPRGDISELRPYGPWPEGHIYNKEFPELPVTPKESPPSGELPPTRATRAPASPEALIDSLKKDLEHIKGGAGAVPEQGPVEGGVRGGARPRDEIEGAPVGAGKPEFQKPPITEEETVRPSTKEVEGEFVLTPPRAAKPSVLEALEPPPTRGELERAGQLPLDLQPPQKEDITKVSSREIVERIKREREARRKAREEAVPGAPLMETAPSPEPVPELPPVEKPPALPAPKAPAPSGPSFKVEVTDGSGYVSNVLRFATPEEATAYGHDLMGRWMAAKDFRVTESDEPVGHRWDDTAGKVVYLDREQKTAPAAPEPSAPAPAPEMPAGKPSAPVAPKGEAPTAPSTLEGDVEVARHGFTTLKKNIEGVLQGGHAGDVRKRLAEHMGVPEQKLKNHGRAYEDAIEAVLADKLAGDYHSENISLDQPLHEQIRHAQTIEALMPRAHRGLEKSQLQQFSTPLPLAVAAIHAGRVTDNDNVLEPTAGTGNLLVALPERTRVEATDIDPHRAALLAEQGYGSPTPQDYLKTTYPGEDSPDAPSVIITNPPWGKYSTGKYGNVAAGLGFEPYDVAERFVAKNLRDVQKGGRLVAVMPTTMLAPNAAPFRRWLSNNYSVRAVIQSPPNAYDTRGTKVDSVLLVVDKMAPATKGHMPPVERPIKWIEYADVIEAIPGRPGATAGAGAAPRPAAGGGEPGPVRGQLPTTPKPRPDIAVRERDTGVVEEEPRGPAPKPHAPPAAKPHEPARPERPAGAEGEPGRVGAEDEVTRKADAARQRLKEIAKKREQQSVALPPSRGSGELGMALGAQEEGDDDALEAMVDVLRAIIHDGVTDFRRAILSFEKEFGPEWALFKEELELAWHALQGERPGMDEAQPVDDALHEDINKRIEKSPDWRPYERRIPDLEGAPHPKAVVEAKQLAGVSYPALVYSDPLAKGGPRITFAGAKKGATRVIPEHIVNAVANGWASVEQGEQAIAAVQANSDQKPDDYPLGKKPHGFLMADAVGVGKSREIAMAVNEIMRTAPDEMRLLLVTKSVSNQVDLMQNLAYMWSGRTEDGIDLNTGQRSDEKGHTPYEVINLREWITSKSNRNEPPEPLPLHKKAIYVTTSHNLAHYYYALTQVGIHGIIGDEAHTYKNVWGAAMGKAWQGLHAHIFKNVPREQQKFVYATATPTQDILDYEYLYGLRLWPIDGFDDWVQLITGRLDDKTAQDVLDDADSGMKDPGSFVPPTPTTILSQKDAKPVQRGGAASTVDLRNIAPSELEQIPRELKIMGRMSARDLWREGTEFQIHKAQLPEKHKRQRDEFSRLAHDILDSVVEFAQMNQRARPGDAIKTASSMVQFAAKRFALEASMEEAINVAKDAVAKGYQPVIRVLNVGRVGKYKDENDDIKDEDDAMYDIPLGGHFAAAIEAINTKDVEIDDQGNDVRSDEIPEALVRKGELRERARKFALRAPLDMLNTAFGEHRVAVKIGSMSKAMTQTVRDFQAGRRDVLLISAAGSTGVNLDHRVMIDPPKGHTGEWRGGRRMFINAQFDWSATEEMQAIGRVDRASSITPPFIKPITFGNASEVRFLAVVANRMASLGATSRGGAQATGGARGLEEFEVSGPEMIAAIRTVWRERLSDSDKLEFWGKRFKDPRTPDLPATSLPDRVTAEDVQRAMLFVSIDVANKFWEQALIERDEVRKHLNYGEDVRTKAWTGDVLTKTALTPHLTLWKVQNDATPRHKFGLLVGLIMPEMPRLRKFLPIGASGQPKRSYVTFATTDPETGKERTLTGLEVMVTRTGAIAQEFGREFEDEVLDTPEKVLDVLKSGGKVPLKKRNDNDKRWTLNLSKSQHIVIQNATFADKSLLTNNGGWYRDQGSFWYVKPDRFAEFIERFPPATPAELRVEKAAAEAKAGPEKKGGGEGGGGAQPAATQRYGAASSLEMPPPPLGPLQQAREQVKGKQSIKAWAKTAVKEQLGVGEKGEPHREKKPSEFFTDLRQRHKLPIRVGGFRQAKPGLVIHGLYKVRPQVIRLRLANRVPIIAHEVGHHLDKVFSIYRKSRRAPWRYELVALGQNTSATTAPIKTKITEGIAEFVRLWLTDPDSVQGTAPTFAAIFESLLDKPTWQDLKALQHDIGEWVKLSYPDRLGTRIDMDGGNLDADNRDWIDRFNEKVFNDLGRLDQAVEAMRRPDKVTDDASKLAQMARGSAGVAHGFIEHGIKNRKGVFVSKGLREILQPVSKHLDEFVRYIVALRAAELARRGKETGIPKAEMLSAIETYKNNAGFEDARKELKRFTDATLDYLLEHGIIDAAAHTKMLDAGKYYVPFARIMDGYDAQKAPGAARQIANRKNPLKRYLGSGRDIINPVETIIRNVYSAVDTVMQNEAMKALTRQAAQTEGSGQWLDKVPPQMVPLTFNLQRLEADIRAAMKKSQVDLPKDLDLNTMVQVWMPKQFVDGNQGFITVLHNGKRQVWQVNDKALYNALTAMGPTAVNSLIRMMAPGAHMVRMTATALNVAFGTRNIFRDWIVAYSQGKSYGFKLTDTPRGFFRAIYGAIYGDEVFKQFETSGVMQAAILGNDRRRIQKHIRQLTGTKALGFRERMSDTVASPTQLIQAIVEYGEKATRYGAFLRSMDNSKRDGVPLPEALARAAFISRNSTQDFSVGGEYTRQINVMTAFFGARVGGWRMLGKALAGEGAGGAGGGGGAGSNLPGGLEGKLPPGARALYGLFQRAAMTIFLLSVATWYARKLSDDETQKMYEELPDWEKNNFWHVRAPYTDSGWLRIPKPFELGFLFGTSVELMLDFIYKRDPEKVTNRLKEAFPLFFAKGGGHATGVLALPTWLLAEVMPSLALPFLEVMTNYNKFRDRSIVSPWDENIANDLKMTRWTSPTVKYVADSLGMAPVQFEHVLYSYTGGFGRTLAQFSDLGAEWSGLTTEMPAAPTARLPFWSSFVKETFDQSAQSLQDMYRKLEEARGATRSINKYREQGEDAKADAYEAEHQAALDMAPDLNRADKELKDARADIDFIIGRTDLDRWQKRDALAEVYFEMVNIARDALGRDPIARPAGSKPSALPTPLAR